MNLSCPVFSAECLYHLKAVEYLNDVAGYLYVLASIVHSNAGTD